jgi:hypothetical protein
MVKPHGSIAALRKSEDRFSADGLESDELHGVQVIAAVRPGQRAADRQWLAKDSGMSVTLLFPEEALRRQPAMSDEQFEETLQARRGQRLAVVADIERRGGLWTTPMTFRELMRDFAGHAEPTALDRYGGEATRGVMGALVRSRVRITGVQFTGKETVLQEEAQLGIVSEEEAEAQRFAIRPERDVSAELLMEALRLLPKTEMKQVGIGWRTAGKVKVRDGTAVVSVSGRGSRLMTDLVAYLQTTYPDEIGDAQGIDALAAFVRNRTRLLERWKSIKPGLVNIPSTKLAQIAGCSRREAIRIMKGEVEPGLDLLRRIADNVDM